MEKNPAAAMAMIEDKDKQTYERLRELGLEKTFNPLKLKDYIQRM